MIILTLWRKELFTTVPLTLFVNLCIKSKALLIKKGRRKGHASNKKGKLRELIMNL